jgi:hypothetical protein
VRTREALIDLALLIVIVMLLPLAIPLGIVAMAILFVQRTILWRRSAA